MKTNIIIGKFPQTKPSRVVSKDTDINRVLEMIWPNTSAGKLSCGNEVTIKFNPDF